MVTLDDLKREMPTHCSRFGIAYVDVFGSVARGDATSASDIDLLIGFSGGERTRMSERFFGFLHALEDRYQNRIDLVTESSVKNPILREQIERDRVRVYG